MRPPRTARGRAYIRRVRSTWMTVTAGRDIHVAGVRPEVRAEVLDRDDHRPMELAARTQLHRTRQATVLADKLDAALAHQRVLNNRNRNRRNKRHG